MITAIISAYFAEKYLASRIENLQEQDTPVDVIVVCEAGSTEHVIASKYSVELLTTPDVPTIYYAWNLAIKHAQTEFITNANCDDLLYPGALSYMIQNLRLRPEYCLAYANDDIMKEYKGFPTNRHEWFEGGLDELLQMCFIGPMPIWRRSLHEKYGFFDEDMRSAGDYEFWLRLASSGEKFLHLKRCVGAFLSRSDSASTRDPLRSTWESARARSRYRKQESA